MNEIEQEAINIVINRVVAREALELVHWELLGVPGRLLLRIYIDKPGGVTLGDCETISKEVGLVLDVEDLIPSRYTLEVSSPGLERRLYKPEDYKRFAGNTIKVKLSEPVEGRRSFRGKLEGIVENTVQMDCGSLGRFEIPYDNIVKANIEYKF
jgi:ribosome maturation factor RimP